MSNPESQDQELVQAVFDEPAEEPPVAVPLEEDGAAIVAAEAPPDTEATGVTSHILTCRSSGSIAKSSSTFRAPSTGWLFMRVAYYDTNGVRIWSSPWRNKGSMNALTTKAHVEEWDFSQNFPTRKVKRAVAVSRFPSWTDPDGSRWASC